MGNHPVDYTKRRSGLRPTYMSPEALIGRTKSVGDIIRMYFSNGSELPQELIDKINTLGKNYYLEREPLPTDDITQGYKLFDKILDLVGNEVYVCTDNTEGAAVWQQVSLSLDELTKLGISKHAETHSIDGEDRITPLDIGAESIINKVSEWHEPPSNVNYPSEKIVLDTFKEFNDIICNMLVTIDGGSAHPISDGYKVDGGNASFNHGLYIDGGNAATVYVNEGSFFEISKRFAELDTYEAKREAVANLGLLNVDCGAF
jgi:hypothetical protein